MKNFLKKFLSLIKELYPFIIIIINTDLFIEGLNINNYKDFFVVVFRTTLPILFVEASLTFLDDKTMGISKIRSINKSPTDSEKTLFQKALKKELKKFSPKKFTLELIGAFFSGVAQFIFALFILQFNNDINFNIPIYYLPILFVLLFSKYFLKKISNKKK